jgi:hypothetical protein
VEALSSLGCVSFGERFSIRFGSGEGVTADPRERRKE